MSSRSASDHPALYLPRAVSVGERVLLPEEESRHLRAVRVRTGDVVVLLDGEGHRSQAVVEELTREGTSVRITETVLEGGEHGMYIVAAIGALSDRSRFEWLVEKAVELGVREIIPLTTRRSEGRTHCDRARRIAIAALKQSQRSYLPSVCEPVPFEEMIGRLNRFDHAYICHEAAPHTATLARALLSRESLNSVVLLVGPEGGFTDDEIAAAGAAGAAVVSLSDARLRSETAAVTAIALLSAIAFHKAHS